MAYRIVNCTWESGERYCMLVEAETGMPTWWPTLFVTTQLRNTGQSVSTMDAALGAIQILLSFLEARGIDLEERFLTRQFLEAGEVDALCDLAQLGRRGRRGGGKSRRPDVVSPAELPFPVPPPSSGASGRTSATPQVARGYSPDPPRRPAGAAHRSSTAYSRRRPLPAPSRLFPETSTGTTPGPATLAPA